MDKYRSFSGKATISKKEFEDAVTLSNLFDRDALDEGINIKIKYLLVCIKQQEKKIPEEMKNFEKFFCSDKSKKQEFLRVLNMSEFDKVQYYIDTVNELLIDFFKDPIKKGILQSKSAHLGQWKDKQTTLDVKGQILLLRQGDEFKQFDLQMYTIDWIGKGNEHYKFEIIGKSKDLKIQQITLGSTFIEISKIWYEEIQKVITGEITEYDPRKDILERKMEFSGEGGKSTKFEETQAENSSSKLIGNTANIESTHDSKEQKKNSETERMKNHESPKKSQEDVSQTTPTQINQEPEIIQNQSNQLSSNHPEQKKIQKPNNEGQENQEEQVPVERQIKNYEKNRNVPLIFKQLIPILNIEDLHNEFNYQIIHFHDSMRILQNESNKRKFKLFMTLQASQAKVFQLVSNPYNFDKWNLNINETKVVENMKSENTSIIYQQNKSYGTFYQPRDFVFLRYAFFKNGAYYIFDKSVQHQSNPPYFTVVRGEIDHYFWCILKHPEAENETMLIIDLETENGGFASEDQDGNITVEYLKGFSNLESYAKQANYKEKQQQSYFDVSGDISVYQKMSLLKQNRLSRNSNNDSERDVPKGGDLKDSFGEQEKEISQNQKIGNESPSKSQREFEKSTQSQELDTQEATHDQDEEGEEEQEIKFQLMRRRESKFVLEEDITQGKRSNDSYSEENLRYQIELVKKDLINSFPLHHKFQLAPSKTFDDKRVSNQKDDNYILHQDWRRDEQTGTMYFINQKVLEAQQQVIKFLMKQMGANLLSGKSLTSVSMPVDIFETRSNLERFAYSFSFAPIYLERAAEETDPVEQMKHVVAFTLTLSLLYLNLEKPFNPIIGETYQGFIAGCPVYCEQISHHPPICSFQLYGRGYYFTGYLESTANFHANSVTGMNYGKISVKFDKTGNQIIMSTPPGEVFNTAVGDRYFNLEGQMLLYDEQNSLITDVNFNPDQKGAFSFGQQKSSNDYFAGSIFQVNKKGMAKLLSEEKQYQYQGVNPKDEIEQECAQIEGVWSCELQIDGQQFWRIDNPLPYIMIDQEKPLASDCNYRFDIIFRRLNDRLMSQQYQEKLEVDQRKDRKDREQFEKENKKYQQKHH